VKASKTLSYALLGQREIDKCSMLHRRNYFKSQTLTQHAKL